MASFTVVIITLNEEANIGRCLTSLDGVADEVIILDSGSEDDTVIIATKMGAKVLQVDWKGFAATKNEGNAAATHEYILSVDADEVLSEELREDILAAKKSLSGAYAFNRLNNYCGKWIRHGGFYPDRKVRLFSKKEARWTGEGAHEKLDVDNAVKITQLNGDLLHYTYNSLADHVLRANKYSSLAAAEIAAKGNASIGKVVFNSLWRFVKLYILRGGIRDGFYGLCICAITAYEVFLKYAKAVSISRQDK